MCTLLAKLRNYEFELVMNRDDIPSRRHYDYDDTTGKFVCPVLKLDDGCEGTWISLSHDGSVYALLNADGIKAKNKISRGKIIPRLLGGASIDSVIVQKKDSFDPFQLFMYDGKRSMKVITWNGTTLQETPSTHSVYLTSSSYKTYAQLKMKYITENTLSLGLTDLLKVRNPPIYLDEEDKPSKTIATTRILCTPETKLFQNADNPFSKDYETQFFPQ